VRYGYGMNTAPPASPSPPPPPVPETSIATGFALMLETACSDFEAMQRLVRGETRLVFANGQEDVWGRARAQMALAKSFVFHVVRARRICEHGASSLAVDRLQRRSFLQGTAGVLGIRDVNEHGFDAGGAVRAKSSKPSRHYHPTEDALVDETAMMVVGDQKILMGPLNLHDVYVPTDTMRKLAEFSSLRPPAF
jgi:hypothetical protein